MSCSAIFILDLKGKVIISRNYRGDLDMNVIDKFIPRLIDMEDEGMQTPIICNDDATFIFVKHNNVYVVAISRKNTNVVLVQAFLYKMIQVFCDYFKDVEEESIRDNFVIIYELLDEMMDFGYPQTTEARILREYITQEGHKLDSAPRPPMALTNAVSWRSEGIKYRKNEVFLDVVESVNMLANANSTVLQSEIVGSVKMRVYLSGMPELRLGLNEKIQFENSGRGKNKAVELEDVKFHQCVRLSRFENDRTISFIPPDGEFELMNYRLTTVVKPLIWIEAVVEKFSHSRVEFMIKAKSQFKRRSTANNVEIIVPVPRDADSPKFRAAIGAARYVPENNAFVWSIKSFPGGKEYLMRAQFKLPSVIGEEMEGRRPIKINFEIPYFTTSGIQVRYLKIIEKSGYQALPWVRYITQNGDYQHILMNSVDDWQSIAYLYLWPESERLKKALKENAESSVYTTPVIKSDELLKDEVAEAIQQIQNQPHKRTEHGFDKNAIKALIKEKRLKAALNVTTHILTHAGHGINSLANRKLLTFEVMEIWNCRFQLLMSLKMHKLAFEEMTGFGELDAPDFYFQWQPEFRKQNVNGTLVPFNLRLIHAELPKYSADAAKAYKRIATLENSIQMILTQNRLTAEQTAVWEKRQEVVELTKARLLYTLNDEQNLIGLYQKIASQTSDGNLKREVQKMLVKLASVYGNAKLLEKFCAEAQASGVDGETCKSLKAIFFGKYQEAIDCLTSKQTSTNSNANCNNNAVCLLYLGRVKESVDQLLSHPETTPVLPVILNLFTVAELTTNTLRTEFFMRFSQHFGDLLEPRALRITK